MNLNDKTKRWVIIAGCGLFCAVLIALIGARFIPKAPVDDLTLSSSEESREVIPIIEPTEIQEGKVVVVLPEPQPEAVSEAAPAVSSGTEQTIQPDPVIPSEPEKPVAQGDHTNPDQQPTYKQEDTVKQSQSSTPQNGATSGGKIYVDGFGWIENHGGGASMGHADSNGDINKQVGQMG